MDHCFRAIAGDSERTDVACAKANGGPWPYCCVVCTGTCGEMDLLAECLWLLNRRGGDHIGAMLMTGGCHTVDSGGRQEQTADWRWPGVMAGDNGQH